MSMPSEDDLTPEQRQYNRWRNDIHKALRLPQQVSSYSDVALLEKISKNSFDAEFARNGAASHSTEGTSTLRRRLDEIFGTEDYTDEEMIEEMLGFRDKAVDLKFEHGHVLNLIDPEMKLPEDAKLSERVAYMAGQNEVLERTLNLLISAGRQ